MVISEGLKKTLKKVQEMEDNPKIVSDRAKQIYYDRCRLTQSRLSREFDI